MSMHDLVDRLRFGLVFNDKTGEINEAYADKLMDLAASHIEAQEARIQELEDTIKLLVLCKDIGEITCNSEASEEAMRDAFSVVINTNEAEK